MNILRNLTPLLFITGVSLLALPSCKRQMSLEEKVAEDAKEYNRKYCPTPVYNFSRTDSVAFNKATHTYTFYCTFVENADNIEVINAHKAEMIQSLQGTVRDSPALKQYIEAGIKFEYICRSEKDPSVILLQTKF